MNANLQFDFIYQPSGILLYKKCLIKTRRDVYFSGLTQYFLKGILSLLIGGVALKGTETTILILPGPVCNMR